MKVYVDSENRIHDVGSTKETGLTELEIDDESNPFKDWSVAKICCYKVWVAAGNVMGFTPYVPSSLINHIDQLGKQNEVEDIGIDENSDAVCDIAELGQENSDAITDAVDFMATLEERIIALEKGGKSNG